MIRWLRNLTDGTVEGETPPHDKEVRKVYRRVFSGTDGQEALVYILTDLGFFDELKDPKTGASLAGEALVRASALRDYSRRLLEQLGVLHEGNAHELVRQMMNLPVWEKKER